MTYKICEATIGFAPDINTFDTLQDAFTAICYEANYYKYEKDAYALAKSYAEDGNIDEVSYKYSECWHITTQDETVLTLYINREHFPDGRAIVEIDDRPKFWNYKN